MPASPAPRRPAAGRRALAALALLLGAAACATAPPPPVIVQAPPPPPPPAEPRKAAVDPAEAEGQGWRRERYARAAAAQDYQACREEGMRMDLLARRSGNPGQYLTSARVLEGCEARLGPGAAGVERGERMRVMALAVQNLAKGGDVAGARAALERLGTAFPEHDLYYPDGTSVRASLAMALGLESPADAGRFGAANVNPLLKAELRRARYWQQR